MDREPWEVQEWYRAPLGRGEAVPGRPGRCPGLFYVAPLGLRKALPFLQCWVIWCGPTGAPEHPATSLTSCPSQRDGMLQPGAQPRGFRGRLAAP